jgi:peptidase E
MSDIKRQVIAMGGGGFMMEPENPLLDQYIVEQARKARPSHANTLKFTRLIK